MATQHSTNAVQTVQQVAGLLAAIEWMDQQEAEPIRMVAEAAVNMLMVVAYQGGTGKAGQSDFLEAKDMLRQAGVAGVC